ncbi:MAG: glucosaminidase domain-containing protein [Bacteroidota bacterium]
MTPNQQKSFFSDTSFGGQRSGFRTKKGGVTHANHELSAPGMVIVWALRKVARLIDKLIVLAKYQFYKHTAVAPSKVRLPWTKLIVVLALGFMAFKEDLSFSVGMGKAAQTAKFGSAAVAEEVVLKEKKDEGEGGLFSIFSEEKKDYFAEGPGDNAKDKKIKAYVRRFKDVAIAEKERYGIPASIKMAQAIVESNSGHSALSRKNNNHFGIKCFSKTCKKGHCTNFGDDSHKDFFRKYGSAWESWRAHSKMIVNGRYKPLLKHGNDYKKWAKGLKKLGYATAKHYEQTLVGIIEKYHLHTLDEQ